MSPYSPFATLYSHLLDFCSCPPRFPNPWGFLAAPPDCYGPVADPDRALAALASKYPLPHLIGSGILRAGRGGPRLAPRLTRTGAIIIPLRMTPGGRPFALLAGRGCLPARRDPIWAARRDAWTMERVARGGLLFAAASIADVLLLRALDLPATLAGGLRRLSVSGMGHLQAAFPGPDSDDPFQPGADESDALDLDGLDDPDDEPTNRLTGRPPSLVLVGWSPLALSARPSPTLTLGARRLVKATSVLRYEFPGISVWRPYDQDIDAFAFLAETRSPGRIALRFLTAANRLYHLDPLAAGPPPPPPPFSTAQAALVEALRVAGTRSLEDLGSRAQTDYDAAVRRTLIEPLLVAGGRGLNPVVRASTVQLALTADLMYTMYPHLKVLLTSAMTRKRTGEEAPFPDKEMAQYARLADQFRAMTSQVQRLQGPEL